MSCVLSSTACIPFFILLSVPLPPPSKLSLVPGAFSVVVCRLLFVVDSVVVPRYRSSTTHMCSKSIGLEDYFFFSSFPS
ncbi:hypothetical protein BKA83DRAFT_4246756 [Pisolithus microcarpus]|nr:hypothetical protein BKA83DRAFT_4340224 [Pisolithus microcarpus]KAI6026706.1 hypothetical protein BKA83DRAFT_4246756 [Pisolithus microcarpus]